VGVVDPVGEGPGAFPPCKKTGAHRGAPLQTNEIHITPQAARGCERGGWIPDLVGNDKGAFGNDNTKEGLSKKEKGQIWCICCKSLFINNLSNVKSGFFESES